MGVAVGVEELTAAQAPKSAVTDGMPCVVGPERADLHISHVINRCNQMRKQHYSANSQFCSKSKLISHLNCCFNQHRASGEKRDLG